MRIRDMPTTDLPYAHKVYLTREQGEFLKTKSIQLDCSINELIRETIEIQLSSRLNSKLLPIRFKKNGRRT